METPVVFVSVGRTATPEQETFVRAVEDRLRTEGFIPQTVGRNAFSADAPLKAVIELLSRSSGAVVIAFERLYFPAGVELRNGSKEVRLGEIKLPTSFNQIEAAMAYTKGKPLLVIVESGLRSEGLLQTGYDWHVQTVELTLSALATAEFNGVLASWKEKVETRGNPDKSIPATPMADLTIGQLVSGLKPTQLWAMLTAFGALIATAFALGAKLHL